MYKILTIVGARPQFIKAAAISHTIKEKYADAISEDILHTGQHYDDAMSAQFFRELDIPQPRYNLGVGSGRHGAQTALMLKGIEETLLNNQYDGVLVYGDTNSTLAGALAAVKLHIPVFHVEAGLRSFNREMPEEVNRVLTDHMSALLFAPTETAVHNLSKEGFDEKQIVFSGDVMFDNVLHYSKLTTYNLQLSSFILATIHRDFNTDHPERLKNIITALNEVAEQYDTDILLPIHPRTKKIIDSMSGISFSPRINLCNPLSYLETLAALQKSRLVLTDSGGLQKEANFCDKCSVVLRPETEWVELVNDGSTILADADRNRILTAVQKLIDHTPIRTHHFGDGNAAGKIIRNILSL
jgi:UDP-GlcNAc3NAcA epimerase